MLKKLLLALFLVSVALATVPLGETKRQYFTCNGSTTTFTFTAPANSSDDIQVILRLITTGVPTAQVEDTDYTIAYTGSSYLEGGVVTMGTAPASTYQLVIVREIVQTQETASGAITPVSVEAALDKLTRLIQDIRYDLSYRYLRIPQTDADTLNMEYPNTVARADKNATWDSDGNPTATAQLSTGSANISSFGETLVDDASASAARTTLGLDDFSALLKLFDISVQAADTSDTLANILTTGGIFFKGDNDNSEEIPYALIHSKMTNNRDGYEQGELWLGVLDNINSSDDYITPISINKMGCTIVGPGFTPFGYNRQIALDFIAESSPSSEVTGTDALNYTCIMRNTAHSTNRPITGANWESFWVQTGSAGGAWVDATAYTAHLIFGERLSVFEGDQPDAKPIAVRNVKTSNDNTHTVGIGFSLYNASDKERVAGIINFGFYDATSGGELAEYHLALRNKEYKDIKGPYYRAERLDSTGEFYTNIGPYGTRDMVVGKTANYTLLYGDTKKVLTNFGAKGPITFTLPIIRQVGTGYTIRFEQGVLYLNGTESAFKWTDSPAVPGEYYAELTAGGDPGLSSPEAIYFGEIQIEGTLGSLANGEWAYGNQDTLGYNTIYYKHVSGDLDILSDAIIATYKYTVALGNANESMFVDGIPSSTFIDDSIESDGFLGTNISLISFGNTGADADHTRRWLGTKSGRWIHTGETHGFLTLANSATPSVFRGKLFLTGGTTTITDFIKGVVGQEFTMFAEHSLVITDGTNIFLNGSANWSMTSTDTLTLVQKANGKWYEISRSDSGA